MMARLKEFLWPYTSGGIALAFSGGVDSSLLLAILVSMKQERDFPLLVVNFHSVFHTTSELEEARAFGASLGATIQVLPFDPLKVPGVRDNPVDRCYRCKQGIFAQLKDLADKNGIMTIIDGTNADDLQTYRPGRRALKELGVVSPLSALGITKAEVRALAHERGLSVASKPAAPCLATRFPYGTTLTEAAVQQVAEGESFLRRFVSPSVPVRLRVHGKIARIEVVPESFASILDNRIAIVSKLKELSFDYVTLDLEGFRSGSLDIDLMRSETPNSTSRGLNISTSGRGI